jgi:hypothetical protein
LSSEQSEANLIVDLKEKLACRAEARRAKADAQSAIKVLKAEQIVISLYEA